MIPVGRTARLDPRLRWSWTVSWSLHEAQETEPNGKKSEVRNARSLEPTWTKEQNINHQWSSLPAIRIWVKFIFTLCRIKEPTVWSRYWFSCRRWSHLLTGEEHRPRGQSQFEICGWGLSQLIGSWCEVQHIINKLKTEKKWFYATYLYRRFS